MHARIMYYIYNSLADLKAILSDTYTKNIIKFNMDKWLNKFGKLIGQQDWNPSIKPNISRQY